MLFNSFEYLLFFVAVCAVYYCLNVRAQNLLLLFASYFFYAWWDWRFTSLLLISTVVDYSVGRRMERASVGQRRPLLLISLCTNLGILGFFKYFNFFIGSFAAVLGELGMEAHGATLQIVLPVGISFYTFQTLAYTIDVYRGRIPAERDPIAFGVYVAFFPQLVAGPIERAQHLLPQFRAPRRVTESQLASGGLLILIGLVRKVAIADVAAVQVDRVFAEPGDASSLKLLSAVVFFAIQIYGDFSGYSDIARGCSRMLGIELMQNFSHPYFATSITDFWRRWHISLSTWLRDYLYIPLGGNRGTQVATYRNLMLTMLLGGLWHGAAWTFVVWGGLHGAALMAHKLWLQLRRPSQGPAAGRIVVVLRSLLGWLMTMTVVGIAWVFFRAPDFNTAFVVLKGICQFDTTVQGSGLMVLARLVVLLLLIDIPQWFASDDTVVLRWPWILRGLIYASMILVLVSFHRNANVPFIYFQF